MHTPITHKRRTKHTGFVLCVHKTTKPDKPIGFHAQIHPWPRAHYNKRSNNYLTNIAGIAARHQPEQLIIYVISSKRASAAYDSHRRRWGVSRLQPIEPRDKDARTFSANCWVNERNTVNQRIRTAQSRITWCSPSVSCAYVLISTTAHGVNTARRNTYIVQNSAH